MAELCFECFLDTWNPDAYDRAHIIMSNDNEFCEGCMDCVPYVEAIDQSEKILTPTINDFRYCVSNLLHSSKQIVCTKCGAVFENDDIAFISEIGECPYCHKAVLSLWVKGWQH